MPHYIATELYADNAPMLAKVNPPLRSVSERIALEDEVFDWDDFMYATDHAPHTLEEKNSDNPPSGISSEDMYGELAMRLFSDHSRLARATSYNAAQWFGLSDRGRIAEGFLADLVIVLGSDGSLQNDRPPKRLYTKCGWTPYGDMHCNESIPYTIKRGKVIAKGGEVLV